MVVVYCIKHFLTGADKHNSILMSLLLLVAETIILFLHDKLEASNRFVSLQIFETFFTSNQTKLQMVVIMFRNGA